MSRTTREDRTDMTYMNCQEAPHPDALLSLIQGLRYKEGWTFGLSGALDRGQGSKGLTLFIQVHVRDSYHPQDMMRVGHLFIVPAASYNRRAWMRWLFERILDVEKHEAMEFFWLGEGDSETRPYAPMHSPGNDPYQLVEYVPEVERRTNYRGEVSEQ